MSESPKTEAASLSLEAALYDSGTGRFSTRSSGAEPAQQQIAKPQAQTPPHQQDKG